MVLDFFVDRFLLFCTYRFLRVIAGWYHLAVITVKVKQQVFTMFPLKYEVYLTFCYKNTTLTSIKIFQLVYYLTVSDVDRYLY